MSAAALDGVAPGADDRAELDLAGRPDVCAVRGWTADAVPQIGEEQREDLLLVVTELVSNAYDHGQRPVSLRVAVLPVRVRLEVTDTSTDPPVLGRSSISDTRGRGMLLIAALAVDWGYTTNPAGKVVWAELDHGIIIAQESRNIDARGASVRSPRSSGGQQLARRREQHEQEQQGEPR